MLATVKHWLSEVGFLELTEDKSGPMYYDGFSYSMTAAYGCRHRVIHGDEGLDDAFLAKLAPLITWL